MKRAAVLSVLLFCSMVLGHFWFGRDDSARSAASWTSTDARLILDAGHGGEDGGAVSLTGIRESDINLSIVRKASSILGLYGEQPLLLRTEDISLHDPGAATLHEKKVSDLKNRVQAVNSTENGILISVHQNTYGNRRYHGAQVFYRSDDSLPLAQLAQERLREALDPGNQRVPARIPESVYLMKHVQCPAILIECGFLSNPEEEARLRSAEYQKKTAAVIVSVWRQYTAVTGEK